MPIVGHIIICGALGAVMFAAGVWVGTQLMLNIVKETSREDK